jgi:hypothetical protein
MTRPTSCHWPRAILVPESIVHGLPSEQEILEAAGRAGVIAATDVAPGPIADIYAFTREERASQPLSGSSAVRTSMALHHPARFGAGTAFGPITSTCRVTLKPPM